MPSIDLTNTYGALLIGILVSAVLFGVTCAQVFHYFQNYTSDGMLIKGVVIVLVILETLHLIFSIHAIYTYIIINYFNPAGLLKDVWSSNMTQGLSSGILLVVHLFYTRRVYHMSKKNVPLAAILAFLSLAQFGTGIVVTIRIFQLEFWAAYANSKNFIGLIDTTLALAVATDILIAASLSFYLHTSRSGVGRTDSMINRLMAHAINNGLLTSIFGILVLIFVTTEVNDLRFFSVFQVVGNLYTNSMMATLNSRHSLAQMNYPVLSGRGQATASMKLQGSGSATMVPSEHSQCNEENEHNFIKITSTKDVQIV